MDEGVGEGWIVYQFLQGEAFRCYTSDPPTVGPLPVGTRPSDTMMDAGYEENEMIARIVMHGG